MKCLFLLLILGLLAACEKKPTVIIVPESQVQYAPATHTLETAQLGSAIDQFKQIPDEVHAAEVRKAFAALDGEIAELDGYIAQHEGDKRREAEIKRANLQEYRMRETARFASLQIAAGMTPDESTKQSVTSAKEEIKDAAKDLGKEIKETAKDVGQAVKEAVR